MAINFPGPYEVRIYYTVAISGAASLTHSQRLNLRVSGNPAPGTPFSGIDALRRDDSPFALSDEVDDWVDLIKPLWNNGAGNTIDYAELWKYTTGTFDAEFISVYPIAVAATSASSNSVAAQNIITFRTDEGGIMKLSFLETVIGIGLPDTLPFTNVTLDAIADAVVAGTVPWMGRDDGYPFACIAMYPGQNEAVFKKRYRP